MEADKDPAKVLRVILTIMYADGSSVLLDVKDPMKTDLEEDTISDTIPGVVYKVIPTKTVFTMTLETNHKTPSILSTYPVEGS